VNLPRELVEAVRRHQVVPFVGAGVSMGVKRELFPSWKQLLEGLAERLEQEALPEPVIADVRGRIGEGDYLTAAELAFKEMGAFRFNRFLRERLRVRRPADAELSVVRALWALRPEVMLTTNYDDVLLWGREGAEPISNDQEDELNLMDAEASPDTPRLWYLHGTIHRLSTLILGGADYARLYGEESRDGRYSHYTSALVRLREWIRSKPFLYVGFSFSDPYVLKQIEHVLGITKGRHVPSFALMKKGSIDRGALWPRYNIQLIEYEDHGPPLAACLNALASAAFGQVPAPAPVRVPMPLPGAIALESFSASPPPVFKEPPHIPRLELEQEYARILRDQHRLVLLAPEDGGARSLARRVAERYGERVTWLAPPNVPDCTEADYCRALAGDKGVTSFDALVEHLRERAEGLGREHLLVLRYEWGPIGHLDTLGKHLQRLMEEPTKVAFHLLVAGGERVAWLLHNVPKFSVYKDAPRREVPDFTVDEVHRMIDGMGGDGARWAGDVHAATGGHLGLIREVLSGEGGLDQESVTARLARSPTVRGALQDVLREDERNGYVERRGCRFVLEALLAGREVDALEPLDHRVEHPEVRLYFAGLVRSDAAGKTVPRCRAVELAARAALERKDVRP
jgi:hypothetical protein